MTKPSNELTALEQIKLREATDRFNKQSGASEHTRTLSRREKLLTRVAMPLAVFGAVAAYGVSQHTSKDTITFNHNGSTVVGCTDAEIGGQDSGYTLGAIQRAVDAIAEQHPASNSAIRNAIDYSDISNAADRVSEDFSPDFGDLAHVCVSKVVLPPNGSYTYKISEANGIDLPNNK